MITKVTQKGNQKIKKATTKFSKILLIFYAYSPRYLWCKVSPESNIFIAKRAYTFFIIDNPGSLL